MRGRDALDGSARMHYLRSYRFFFTCPHWAGNLLFVSMSQMIPVVGPIVLLGYACEVLEGLHRRGEGNWPAFDFNRFGAYLARGLIPLVVYLPVLFLAGIFAFFALLVVRESRLPGRAVSLLMTLLIMGFVVLLVLGLVLVPLSLRASLTRELDVPASMEFVRDFLKRVWKEVLLVWLFALVTGQLLLVAGCLVCIGVYPALVLGVCALHHLMYQLYGCICNAAAGSCPWPWAKCNPEAGPVLT